MDSPETRDVERVRVAVRVRPRNAREDALETDGSAAQHVVDVDATTGQIYVCKKKAERVSGATGSSATSGPDGATDRELRCSFDRVFAPTATQDDVFDYVRDAVQQIAQGFNCTIFAYGQTGTGKTHTMLGRELEKQLDTTAASTSATTREHWGVIPRAVESLFTELASIARHGAAAAIVHCSYMQIYNNEVYDLLQENKARMKEPLAVREMIKGNHKQIYVSGLSEFRVTSLDETLRLLRQGNKNRTIRATEYNEKSSRSHALLQLSAEVESRGAEGPTTIIRRAKLSLVDLAGSEKWGTDVAMGAERCKELTSINQSLSALGNVISALANPKRAHVPYRDAKLTRLLQDSLGGNTRTTVIATISQDPSAIEETISTLLFAERAKCVTLRVQVNEMVDDAVLLAQARREIARLKLLLKKNASQEQLNELEQKVAKLTRENAVLASENKRLRQAMAVAAAGKRDREKATGTTTAHVDSVTAQDMAGHRVLSPRPTRTPDVADKSPSVSLRLDLRPRDGANPSAERERAAVRAVDEDRERADDAERDQALLLEQIQSERRVLEQELARIEQLQTPRRAGGDATTDHPHNSNGAGIAGAADDDDRCPMCHRNIDDHSDDELDLCIERETAVLMPPQPSETTRYAAALPSYVAAPRTPPAASRKPTTPRSSGGKKPSSPYSQELLSKPLASLSPAPSRSSVETTPSSSKLTAQRRSVRDLAHERTTESHGSGREGDGSARPSTAGSSAKSSTSTSSANSNNNNHDDQELRTLTHPIVHQGSKSVKALKKFQAASPYRASLSTNRARGKAASSSPPRPVSNNDHSHGNNNPTTTTMHQPGSSTDRITGSLRDIGLSLLVYKFRYDCWYPCTVVGFDSKRRLHCCQYEYGDKQWQDLTQNKLQIVGRTSGE